jgi:hypothetical protein
MAERGARLGDINRLPPRRCLRDRADRISVLDQQRRALLSGMAPRPRLSDGDRGAILDGDAAKPLNLR